MAHPFFTIGHSTRPIGAFVDLLREADIQLVADVRTIPRSRNNPQFNSDVLPAFLAASGIGYMHIAELGGLRSRSRDVPSGLNGFWENESFHNYADYAMGSAFRSGLGTLRKAGRTRRCAVMCAEAVWWRCHRRIIADYLLAAGETVIHIMGNGRAQAARSTASATPGPKGTVIYPASRDALGAASAGPRSR
jgi:uncharacterized protein (DUF488 family)